MERDRRFRTWAPSSRTCRRARRPSRSICPLSIPPAASAGATASRSSSRSKSSAAGRIGWRRGTRSGTFDRRSDSPRTATWYNPGHDGGCFMTRPWRDYNYFLLGCVVVLTGFSLAMVYSATLKDPITHGYFSRHLVNLIVGGVAMLLLTALDYHAL